MEMNKENLHFCGIDLGTTNTIVSSGYVDNQGKLNIEATEIEQIGKDGARVRSQMIPSAVFYEYDRKREMFDVKVGAWAKERYGQKAGQVCKSVKSQMGSWTVEGLRHEIPDKTAGEVSARILQHVVKGVNKTLFQTNMKDFIITVPASYDSDQCAETLEAAKLAGIDIENQHDILLYEPKAVLYYLLYLKENGKMPPSVIDFEKDKNILVFDLGGGTLDVSVHKVGYNTYGILDVQDLAISRYTKIGGDNFDEVLAKEILRRFEEMYGITVPKEQRETVLCRCRQLAEGLKIEISDGYEQAKMQGVELSKDTTFEVMDMCLYDSYSYDDEFSIQEVEDIFETLIGKSYTMDTVKNIQNLKEEDNNNIIYPILDVLDKAGNISIDAVVLNGGMTKYYYIQERLNEFFGLQTISNLDPDLSVSKGAVYYHYCLHKYNIKKEQMFEPTRKQNVEYGRTEVEQVAMPQMFTTGTILNDNINIGLQNEYVECVIEAGTKLPYTKTITGAYEFSEKTDKIGIDILLGRGTTKNFPNRRIAKRFVQFKQVYKAGTPLTLKFTINAMKEMVIEAWITGQEKTKVKVEVDTNGKKFVTYKKSNGITKTNNMMLNPVTEINAIKNAHDMMKSRNCDKGKANSKLANKIKMIGKANNPEQFFPVLYENAVNCSMRDPFLGSIYDMSELLFQGWTLEQRRKMKRLCEKHFEDDYVGIQQDKLIVNKAKKLIALL